MRFLANFFKYYEKEIKDKNKIKTISLFYK